ncbi:MAG: hypothetical protein KatS3mg052_2033 [Candidatus Roseilinea sp.]|nr:MAG: hypothetical protein KatS3mg052_2033 [Candidatus Roseilinea sp.]
MSDDALLALPDLVPARMVNEFAYCPRLAYLEWVQGDWADNADTADGRYKHRRVDHAAGRLPASPFISPSPLVGEEAGGEGSEGSKSTQQPTDNLEPIHARSVWLSAEAEHLTARIDLLEGDGQTVTPVDYKRGSAPDLPEGAWEADRVQLCAQGLILRANGYTCAGGVIYYIESKTRVSVPFDDALIARTRALVQGLREMAAAGQIPPPLVDSPKCVRCSLAPICLPDEVNLLNPPAPTPPAAQPPPRRLMPARDDAAPLYVSEPGARVSKRGEVFEIWLKDQRLGEARIFETSHLALFGSVQITTPALVEALDRGITIAFFSMGGWFKGLAHGPAHKNVALRMAQYRAAFDPARSLALARAFVSAKIRNCRTLLMRNHTAPPKDTLAALMQLVKDARAASDLPALLGIEGNARPALLRRLRRHAQAPRPRLRCRMAVRLQRAQPPPPARPRQRPALLRLQPAGKRADRDGPNHRLRPLPGLLSSTPLRPARVGPGRDGGVPPPGGRFGRADRHQHRRDQPR